MRRVFGARRYALAAVLLTGLAATLALPIALGTRFNVHPDEFIQVDAFCYFQTHRWMPPLDVDGLNYGDHGQSRVYTGEIVYWVYGRAAAALARLGSSGAAPVAPANPLSLQLAACQPNYLTYRLFNVALLVATLAGLFVVGLWQAWVAAIAVSLICLPQVIYVYSYANSDGWALTWSLALLVFALAEPRPLSSLWKALLLGALSGMVLLSKETGWLAVALAGLLVGWRRLRRARQQPKPRLPIHNAAAVGAVLLLIIAPTVIVYPLSQGGHLAEKLDAIRNERAQPGLQPSDPYAPGFHLRDQGAGFESVFLNTSWMQISAMSFYGLFGYLDQRAPVWTYLLALALAALNALLTLGVIRRNWPALPEALRLALVAGPAFTGLVVLASMANSWLVDYQPQGRYLFLAIFPIALWLWGALPWESARLRWVRLGSLAVLLALSAGVIWLSVLQNPVLRL